MNKETSLAEWMALKNSDEAAYTKQADLLNKNPDPWQRYAGWMNRIRAQEIREMSVAKYMLANGRKN